jgi:hypothetical protein
MAMGEGIAVAMQQSLRFWKRTVGHTRPSLRHATASTKAARQRNHLFPRDGHDLREKPAGVKEGVESRDSRENSGSWTVCAETPTQSVTALC